MAIPWFMSPWDAASVTPVLEPWQTEALLAGLAIGCFGGVIAILLLRRRTARDVRAAASSVASPEAKRTPDGRPASAELRPLLLSVEATVARLRSQLDRVVPERDALLTALSRMGDGVMVTDRNGTVVSVNDVQLSRLQLPEQKVVGRSFIEVVQDHEVNDIVRRCLVEGRPVSAVVETAPGRSFLNVTATPVGREGGCAVVLEDLSEVHRLERVRRDFVANISHELRTPLASLKLLSETLSSGGADDTDLLRDYLGRIDVEVDRLAQMVEELGELSLLETGQVSLERKSVNVAVLVEGAVGRLEAQAERAGLSVTVDVPDDLPDPIGDARRLEQALVNLVHNAIKFTPAGGSVTVAARRAGAGVSVSVSDTGVGINEDDLERVFERFYKADRSRTSPGTGLGLAIVRHVVELHGGRVRAESRRGSGATFTFTLPLDGRAG